MNDYEVLGLKEGADEKEVKRAYFKLVRQFSPEKDPERFQQIREAYENLKEGRGQVKLALKIPDDPFAGKMFQQIETLYGQHDYEYAMETAEEAIRYYGECEGFLYYLALLQRENNYSGKAVKNFEKLVKLAPDNVHFAKQLAVSYMERGYGKKAYQAFEKAYAMGCRDVEFLNDYALICKDRDEYARGITLLFELIEVGSSDRKNNVMNLLNAYAGLFMLSLLSGCERLEDIRHSFLGFLDEMSPYMAEYEDYLGDMLLSVVCGLKMENRFKAEDEKIICEKLRRGIGREKADIFWKDIMINAECGLIPEDDRLSDPWKAWCELILMEEYAEGELDEQTKRFILSDCKLCILEEWPDIKMESDIIREDYHFFYGIIQEYVETLEQNNNIDYLRGKMMKDYDRLQRYFPEGLYGEKYGKHQSQPDMFWEDDDFDMEPYMRSQPKIGRNDPCPCGSGKKYKKCCGKG